MWNRYKRKRLCIRQTRMLTRSTVVCDPMARCVHYCNHAKSTTNFCTSFDSKTVRNTVEPFHVLEQIAGSSAPIQLGNIKYRNQRKRAEIDNYLEILKTQDPDCTLIRSKYEKFPCIKTKDCVYKISSAASAYSKTIFSKFSKKNPGINVCVINLNPLTQKVEVFQNEKGKGSHGLHLNTAILGTNRAYNARRFFSTQKKFTAEADWPRLAQIFKPELREVHAALRDHAVPPQPTNQPVLTKLTRMFTLFYEALEKQLSSLGCGVANVNFEDLFSRFVHTISGSSTGSSAKAAAVHLSWPLQPASDIKEEGENNLKARAGCDGSPPSQPAAVAKQAAAAPSTDTAQQQKNPCSADTLDWLLLAQTFKLELREVHASLRTHTPLPQQTVQPVLAKLTRMFSLLYQQLEQRLGCRASDVSFEDLFSRFAKSLSSAESSNKCVAVDLSLPPQPASGLGQKVQNTARAGKATGCGVSLPSEAAAGAKLAAAAPSMDTVQPQPPGQNCTAPAGSKRNKTNDEYDGEDKVKAGKYWRDTAGIAAAACALSFAGCWVAEVVRESRESSSRLHEALDRIAHDIRKIEGHGQRLRLCGGSLEGQERRDGAGEDAVRRWLQRAWERFCLELWQRLGDAVVEAGVGLLLLHFRPLVMQYAASPGR